MDVEVMYAQEDAGEWSFRRERCPVEGFYELPQEGVLFIILSAECSERPRLDGCRRVAESHGYDNYVLARIGNGWMLDGWNDNQFSRVNDEDDPFACCAERQRVIPLFTDSDEQKVFIGIEVPDTAWAAALILFNEEMH